MANRGTPIIVNENGSYEELEKIKLEPGDKSQFNEEWLQNLIDFHPNCLPIEELEPGFDAPVAVCRELPTKHGYIDNFLMTADGDLILVETKLWRNPQARREVLSQAMDYASCLFGMDYSELEESVKKGVFRKEKPKSLYAIFESSQKKAEQDFIDAVNLNLKRGRILILIVGDGIRSEAKRLVENIKIHAGFHFTLALVEIPVFKMPHTNNLIAVPRTLAQTIMIERGIFRIDESGAKFLPAKTDFEKEGVHKIGGNITSEKFFEAINKIDGELPNLLKNFIDKLEGIGGYPHYLKSLVFKYDPPEGRSVNLGNIRPNGDVWTYNVCGNMPDSISHPYLEALARIWGGTVNNKKGKDWYVEKNGRPPKLIDIKAGLDDWIKEIENLIDALNKHYANMD